MDTRTDTATTRVAPPTASRRPAHAGDPTTRALVTAGVVAGPLFVAVGLVQVLTREGFDLTRHPLSLLSLGELGWVQIANFIVAGVLMLAFAGGLAWMIGSPPLLIIILLVLAMAVIDVVRTVRERPGNARS